MTATLKKTGTAKWRNGGNTERRKMTPNPKRENRGTAERQNILQNPKRRNNGKSPAIRNDGNSPEILKDEIMGNHPISQEELWKVKKARVCETPSPSKILIYFAVVENLSSFRFLPPILV